jgi:hypothetical protein
MKLPTKVLQAGRTFSPRPAVGEQHRAPPVTRVDHAALSMLSAAGSRAAPVEVLRGPRARAAALGLARSLARWLADRRPPGSAGVEVATGRVTVVRDADTGVLVHRVETALVAVTRERPARGPQRVSNARSAADTSGKRTAS